MTAEHVRPASPHVADMSMAPVPTRWTVVLRTCIPWQMVRFVVINLKMLRLIRRSH
jgi:hypothetical protein